MIATVTPLVGVNQARFGMTSEQVKQALGGESRPFRRAGGAVQDYFPVLGIFVGYDAEAKAVFFQLTSWSKAQLHELDVFETRLAGITKFVESKGAQVKKGQSCIVVPEWGLALRYPYKDERNPKFESLYLTNDSALLPATSS